MKKMISLLLSVVLTLSLTACGGKSGENQPQEQLPASAPETVPPPAVQQPGEAEPSAPAGSGKVLVAYFSATGSTRAVAETIAETLGADLFEIVPADPYTSDDLDWTDKNSRVTKEHDDPALQDVALTVPTPEDWTDYDTVFVGYPIWWHIAAWPTSSFVKANDFTGKTVIPFCTSSSSGLEDSGTLLAETAGSGEWLEGRRFQSHVDSGEVAEWAAGLNLSASGGSGSSGNVLIAYFTADENRTVDAVTSASVTTVDGAEKGLVRAIADMIQSETGGTLFSIRTAVPYSGDRDEVIDAAAEEQRQDARPELTSHIEDLDGYDTVFVGYPNWWADLPQALYSFFDEYDFSGKTIIPFNVHNGSRFSRTIQTIQELEPGANVIEDGFTVIEQNAAEASGDVASWLGSLGF